MSEQLKRCPFCGGKAKMERVKQVWDNIHEYCVKCYKCNANIYYSSDSADNGKTKVIEAWNRRAE